MKNKHTKEKKAEGENGRGIPINLAGLPKGRLVLSIDGEHFQSYYRTKDKLFIKPIDHDQT